MLNSLGSTCDGVFISARDSVMLRRMFGMQCHGRLKHMREDVAIDVASCNRLVSHCVLPFLNVESKEAHDTLKLTKGYGDRTMCVGSTHGEIDSTLLQNIVR